MAFKASCTTRCTMASVRLRTMGFWPPAGVASSATMFLSSTSSARAGAGVPRVIAPRRIAVRSRSVLACLSMSGPPRVVRSTGLLLPIARRVDQGLERGAVLEERGLGRRVELPVQAEIVERHLVFSDGAHD